MAEIKKILYSKNNRTLILLITTPKEIQTLQGQHKNIILLPTDVKRQKTKIAKRGKKERTTYILVPKNMRQDLTKQKKVEITRIDTNKNIFFIQAIKKKVKRGKRKWNIQRKKSISKHSSTQNQKK